MFPTICDIIKISDKNSQQDGISLVELMEGKNIEERAIYSETSLNLKNKNEGGYGVRTSKYKYFKSSSKNQKNIHLYDLEKDPFEEVNIAEYNKKIVEKMENILTNLMSSETNDNEKDFIRKQIEKKRKKLLDN